MARIRTVDFLPEIFKTPVNRQFLSATLDQLVQEPKFQKTQGYVGRKVGPGVNPADKYVIEPTKSRNDYQLEPGVVSVKPDSTIIEDVITYPGITDALNLQGAITDNQDRLYNSEYYSWDPFVDFDKMVNFSQYYWLPSGPDSVDVSATVIPVENTFTVTRSTSGYTFNGVAGTNPTLTLKRGGNYYFDVAQNNKETINYRVQNNGTSAYVIDLQTNPTLTLVRGNTYNFNLSLDGIYPLWIKTQLSLGIVNPYNNGVTRNGSSTGTITFTVPQDAPDTLYYCSSNQFNMRGTFNIVDGTPGTGAGFWIQTDPGTSGVVPSTPNISSRDVLGVTNNGEDLGTVTFNVPSSTAQNFYYTLNSIGTVGLVTDLQFNQINNQPVETFNSTYGGIDGITSLSGLTLVFQYQVDGWERTVLGDPFAASEIPASERYGIWKIEYVTIDGTEYIQLNSYESVSNLSKFSILYGTEFSTTQWYKNAEGYFQEIPVLSAIKSVLYYQDSENSNFVGFIKLVDNDTLDIDEIIGKKNYTSPNGVVFTNGLKVQFVGSVTPSSYTNNEYYVEGVGTAIQLLPVTNYVTPETYTESATVPYDSTPYDVGGYDATSNAPLVPDYLTINRASPDLNAWSRSNRWFHVDVINASAEYNNVVPVIDNEFRARRPILEYRAGTRLFNFGTEGKQPVDIIDFSATDALSTINGATGYGIDGYTFIDGTRVIFANDSDPQVRNKIYVVEFITPDTVPPLIAEPIINLVPASDATVLVNQTVVSLRGLTQQGKSFWFDGVDWISAQDKTKVNQAPLFNVYDSNGISFSDRSVYPSSTFEGSKLFSYAVGTGTADPVLGFALSYFSLTNVGDIVFENNLYNDTFVYVENAVGITSPISQGFVYQYSDRTTFVRELGWQTAITPSIARQQFQFTYDGSPLLLDIAVSSITTVPAVEVFVNSKFISPDQYTVTTTTNTTTITWSTTFVPGDIVEVLAISDQVSKFGFYQVPINLANNPLNANSSTFTLGTIRTHYESIGENLVNLQGPINGANNSRDLGNLVPYGLQILQQSSPMTLAGYFMRSQDYNIFDSLDYNSREYIKFKSQLLETVVRNDYTNMTIAEILDSAIADITLGRTDLNPFYWSDMLPSGSVYTETVTTVTPITTSVFDTQQTYDFTSANYLGLSVYLTPVGTTDAVLLEKDVEYTVATDGPRLTITITLSVGDVVTIREYSNTAGNFVPNTPTKMGLYPKFRPEIYLDTSYVNPTLVIRGHDGSITVAFEDFRDQVLLEFEKRIYNNLKTDGNPVPLTQADVIPGFFRTTDYSQAEITSILNESFLTWVGWNKIDYKTQDYISGNEFTYNYSQAGNKINGAPLLGAWRGIYRYFYDCETPNTTPWEMLGFSEEPTWWQERYGPAPYTSGNLVLWEDLEAGYVADPITPYTLEQYARPGLLNIIPAGSEGELLSPLNSVVGVYDPNGFRKSWVAGDGGPAEAAWWTSSSYPFAVMRLLALTKPAQFFSLFADRDLYKYSSEFAQYLYNGRYRLDANGVQVYGDGTSKASYINWIVDYNRQLGINSTTALTNDLKNLDVRLCYRMASFTDKQYLKIYSERSSPNSLNSSLLLPDESYNLLLYKNQPFSELTYSAVIVEKVDAGYAVYGYSNAQPYFEIFASQSNGTLQTVSAGGTSVRVPKQYTTEVVQVPYGFVFTNTTVVVDFLLSYGAYLANQGLVFDDVENGYTLDWNQMAQEFLYFSQQGWATGTMINLNPVATSLKAVKAGAVVDTIESVTPENMVIDQNKYKVATRDLIIDRQENAFSITTATKQTLAYVNLKFTNFEHIVVLDNISIFSDLIYDPVTAARQSRIKIVAATSTDWNGTLDAQGFILNQNNVKEWQSNKKYAKGEIVLYKNNYWSAQTIVQPKVEFDYNDWVKSDYTKIQKGLLPNIANKADQLANSYDTQSANLEQDNDLLSYGLIGFRPRQYMTALNLDDVSQVNIYQQFLKTKGTVLSTDIFSRADLGKESAEYTIYENWGVLTATYGANANRSFFELQLNEANLKSDPSTIQVIQPQEQSSADQTVQLDNVWRSSYKLTSTDILPTTYVSPTDIALPSAGYVNLNDVDITVFSLDDPTNIAANIDNIGVGTTIWVAKTNSYDWNVYRCGQVPGRMTKLVDNLDGTSIAYFSTTHGLTAGDLIVIRYFNDGVNGVYRVLSTPTINTVTIAFAFTNTDQTTVTGTGLVFNLETMRVDQASDVASLHYANLLIPGAKAWVDNNGQGHWVVLEKQQPFTISSQLQADPVVEQSGYGTSVTQSPSNLSALVGSPLYNSGAGAVYTYRRGYNNQYVKNSTLELNAQGTVGFGTNVKFGNQTWSVAGAPDSASGQGYVTPIYLAPGTSTFALNQILVAPDTRSAIKFGASVSISSDERWIYVGAPDGTKVYAYNRVDLENQNVKYVTDGERFIFNYSNDINIDYTQPDQLLVTVGNRVAEYSTEYTLNANAVVFVSPPATGQVVTISRRKNTEFTGDGSTTEFIISPYLYTATEIDSFAVTVNSVLQRPYIDYTFNAGTLTIEFTSAPSNGTTIIVTSDTYWKYIDTITVAGLSTSDQFGYSVATTTDGRQVAIGCPYDDVLDSNGDTVARAGSVYMFDRSVVRYQITDTTETTYAMPGTVTEPVSVLLNGTFLTNSDQFINGQFSVVGSDVVLSTEVILTVGDILEIETNQFQQIEKVADNAPTDESKFGAEVVICPTNCSLYTGSPLDSVTLIQEGSVQRNVNQSRVYGITTSTIANPTLTAGNTLRINNYEVEVAVESWTNTTAWAQNVVVSNSGSLYRALTNVPVGTSITDTDYWYPTSWNGVLAYNINQTSIPNITSTVTADVAIRGDGKTKVFSVGTIYADADSYNTLVYVDNVKYTSGVDYSYNSTEQTITFTTAPASNSVIVVVSGRLVVSVIDAQAGAAFNKLTVLPGLVGSAFNTIGFDTYVWTQKILSPAPSDFANFGSSIAVNSTATNLVVGAPKGNVYEPVTFDNSTTYFDDHSTTFFTPVYNSGVVYTYDYLPSAGSTISNPGQFVFGQQIFDTTVQSNDQYGISVSYISGRLLVGVPGNDLGDSSLDYGQVSIFDNPNDTPAWATIHQQQPVVDVYLLNSVFSYDKLTSDKQTYFDFFNPLQGKILGAAQSNIDYIGAVDPASYNNGPIHNNGNSWASEHIGEIWWDTDTVRFIDPNQDDITYASRRWGQVFPGSRVDIYQWIESAVPPSVYTGPGIPLSLISYSVGSRLSKDNVFETQYYFWVRGLTTINTTVGKTLSTTGISRYIEFPRSSGIPYIAPINSSTVAIYNALDLISAQDTILHIEYDRELTDANVHTEYELVAAGDPDAFLTPTLYRKLQDSFCGVDTRGGVVPDPLLSPAERYGVQFRPRQSMFSDRYTALQNYLERANSVLKNYPISETKKFNLLNSAEPEPTSSSGEWNKRVANLEELAYQNLLIVPYGYKYLVVSDSSQNGLWTIYEVIAGATLGSRELQLRRVQNYDTRQYWDYINWYEPGYNTSTKQLAEVANYSSLSTLTLDEVPVGDTAKVTANGQGKWEIYLRTLTGWQRVGLQDGTIAFKEELWNYAVGNFGFDVEVFDAQYFDQEPSIETRKIIQAINEELFVDELLIERNRSLMLVFEYVYSEFTAPEWLIKTSLVDVNHKIRDLLPYQIYMQDNQDFVLDYIQEVKPYHVQIREFNLAYNGFDSYNGTLTDFDNPAYWDTALTIPQYVSPILLPYTHAQTVVQNTNSDVASNAAIWSAQPWIEWFSNYLLGLQEITIVDAGEGYTTPPVVTIGAEWQPSTVYSIGQQIYYESNLYTVSQAGTSSTLPPTFTSGTNVNGTTTLTYVGTPATAVSIINSAGNVVGIEITVAGSGYVTTPTVTLTGGNGLGARAYAVMSNDLVRSIVTTIKFDRYEYQTTIVDWEPNVQYDNGTLVRYLDTVWEASNADSTAVENSIFDLEQWTKVDASTLSGVDRTMGLYVSTPNQPGLSLPLLIDGVEYPGVQVTGPGFNQNTGFDVGNFDINPFDNISYGPEGRPTYDPGILDAIYESYYGTPVTGPIPTGTAYTDINVEGGGYIDTYSSYAPEELIPGSEFDTLDLRVYTRPGSDWGSDGHGFAMKIIKHEYTSSNPTMSFAELEPDTAVIEVANQSLGNDLLAGVDYSADWPNQTITITSGASEGDIIVISAYEVGGGNQLFQGTYNGADVGNTIIVPVEYAQIQEMAIFVNGEYLPVDLNDSTENYSYAESANNTTTITFLNTYTLADYLAVFVIGPTTIDGTTINYSWSTPLTQIIPGATGVYTYDLTNSLEYTNPVNMIVTVNGVRARTAASVEYFGDGSTAYELPSRLGFSQSLIADNEVLVYINNIPQILGVDYTVEPWDGSTAREVIFSTAPTLGEQIIISVITQTQCFINSGQLVFNPTGGLLPIDGSNIAVTTWNDTRQQNILTSVYVGPVTTGITVTSTYDELPFDLGWEFNTATVTFAAAEINQNVTYTIASVGTTDFTLFGAASNTVGTVFTASWVGARPTNGTGTVTATVYSRSSAADANNDTPDSFDYSAGDTVTTNNLTIRNSSKTDPSRLWVTLNGERLFNGSGFTISGNQLVLTKGVMDPSDIVMITEFTNNIVPEAMAFRIFQDMRGVQATYRMTPNSTTELVADLASDDDIIYVQDASVLGEPNFDANIWGVITINGERIMYRERNTTDNTVSSLLRGTAGTAAADHATGSLVYDMGRGNLLPEEYQNYIVSNSSLADGSTTTFTAADIDISGADSSADIEAVEVYVGGSLVTAGYSITSESPVVVEFDTAPTDGVEVTILVRRGVWWYNTAVADQSLQETDTKAAKFLRGEI